MSDRRARGTRWRSVAASAAAATMVALAAAALAPLTDRDEPQYAEVVREMRATGDWLVPRYFGGLFADKPPGIYWLQGASTAVFGESEVALRLPGALSAGLLLLLAAAIAGRLGADGGAAGTLALPGIVAAGVFATPDAPVAAAACTSLWAFLRASDGVDRWPSALLGWVALAAGVALKGPAAPLFVGAALLGRLWGDPAARTRLHVLPGLLVLTALTAAWFVPANVVTGWEYARRGLGHDVVARALEPLEHHGVRGVVGVLLGPPFYALTLLVAAFPFGTAPLRLWRARRALPQVLVRTIACGTAIPLAVLCLVATKLPHYLLPVLPLVAVAAAGLRCRGRGVAWAVSACLAGAIVVVANLAPWRPAGRVIAGGPPVLAVGVSEPSLLYYARGAVRVVTPAALIEAARRGTTLALLDAGGAWPAQLVRAGVRTTLLRRWHGVDLAKGRVVSPALYRLTPPTARREGPGE